MTINKNKLSTYLPIIIAFALVAGILIGIAINQRSQVMGNLMLYPKNDKIQNILRYIQEEYVDTVSSKNLSEKAIVSVLKELDPHSAYIPAEEFNSVTEPLEGNFSGIGVHFNMQNDTVVVINTIPNGPSALVGVMAGDRIVKVNDTVVAGVKWESDAIVKRLKGPRGTKVLVHVVRPGVKRLLSFEITRNTIPLNSVDVSYMLDESTGYIKISQFARTTPAEFVAAVTKLRSMGMKKVILDLRGNGGGYLDAATALSDHFLTDGKLIVYTQGRARKRENFFATSSGICHTTPVAVIIDEFSASASEILAGAIQDNDRGIIIGRRSFGKGLVQEQVPLNDGSALRLTVARYYTPTGRSIQKPYTNGSEDYYKDIANRYLHGEFENKDSIRFNDSLKFKTPGGKTVYAGGGIMPDIFVPVDTSGFSPFYDDVRNMGLIYTFSFNFSDSKRDALKRIKTLEEFESHISKIDIFQLFQEFAEKKGVKANPKDIAVSRKLIDTQLRAYIVRNFFDDDGFYPKIREIDHTIDIALQELNKSK